MLPACLAVGMGVVSVTCMPWGSMYEKPGTHKLNALSIPGRGGWGRGLGLGLEGRRKTEAETEPSLKLFLDSSYRFMKAEGPC